ncbi:MAG TPA: type II toxin-antitoxin system death-on-curing family toxin [Myxococcales bacterium]|nr:type II toxin-antitoxin system death-on-curing family toxin [Myxococcales bacterium]
MAAAYLFHLTRNHPFVDGNTRIGLAAAIGFLGLNDLWLEADPDELQEMVFQAGRGEIGKPEIAVFLRDRCSPLT